MKKLKLKSESSLGITNPLSISKLIDKKIEPLVDELEQKLKIIAKEENLKIDGLIWIHPCK